MKKIKLTQAQVDAINSALEEKMGDIDRLLIAHEAIMSMKGWFAYPALNDISPQDLHDALKYGYTVESEKVRLTREQIKALEELEYEAGLSINDILRIHMSEENPWSGIARNLNLLSYKDLYDALHKGFEVTEKLTTEEVLDIVRKENMSKKNKSTREELELELDYQLSSLHDAMQDGNIKEIDKIKVRLGEIHSELGL